MTWRPSLLSSLWNTSWSSTKTTCRVLLKSLRYSFDTTLWSIVNPRCVQSRVLHQSWVLLVCMKELKHPLLPFSSTLLYVTYKLNKRSCMPTCSSLIGQFWQLCADSRSCSPLLLICIYKRKGPEGLLIKASSWMEMSEWKGYEKLFKIITVLLLRFMYFFHLDKEP